MKVKPISSVPIKKPNDTFVPGESRTHLVHSRGRKSIWNTLLNTPKGK
jgi:hypothetical protein